MPGCTVSRPLLLPTSPGPAPLAPGALPAPDLRPLATVDSHRPSRERGRHTHLPGSAGTCPDAAEAALHTPSPMGPSLPGPGWPPGPGTPPPPRRGSEPSPAAALPLPTPPPGGRGRHPGHPSPGPHTLSPAPRGPPPPHRVTATAPGPSAAPPPAPPHPRRKGREGVLTGRQDMVRPATARPPPPPH